MTTMDEALPLRERKKAITRRTIVEAAERLFEERGFDNVTVAEIADAANVSVKTLFVYFRSKEDLAFADTWLIDAILEGVRARPSDKSAAQAVGEVLIAAIESNDDEGDGLDTFHRGFDSPGLQSGLLRMWAEYEDRVTAELASESGGGRVAARFHAMQAISIARLVTSREVFDELAGVPGSTVESRLIAIVRAAASASL